MNYVEMMLGEHAIKIGVPMRNGVANCELLSQDRLEVTNRQYSRTSNPLNLLNVTVSDFPATDNADIQHPFPAIPELTGSN